MADWPALFSAALYGLWWPTSKLLLTVRAVLSPFLALVLFIFLPITYLIQAILSVLLFPFRLHILERIETVYIWLGVAGLVGCTAGAILFLVFKFLTVALSIDEAAESRARAKGRTMKEYRAARREKQEVPIRISSGRVPNLAPRSRRRGGSSQAILEEESEF